MTRAGPDPQAGPTPPAEQEVRRVIAAHRLQAVEG